MNDYQIRFGFTLVDMGFECENGNETETSFTKTLRSRDKIRVVLNNEGEKQKCGVQVFVFNKQLLAYEARFGFNVPKQAIINFIQAL